MKRKPIYQKLPELVDEYRWSRDHEEKDKLHNKISKILQTTPNDKIDVSFTEASSEGIWLNVHIAERILRVANVKNTDVKIVPSFVNGFKIEENRNLTMEVEKIISKWLNKLV